MKQITKNDIEVRYVDCLRSCHDTHTEQDRCDKCATNQQKGCQYVVSVSLLREVLKYLLEIESSSIYDERYNNRPGEELKFVELDRIKEAFAGVLE